MRVTNSAWNSIWMSLRKWVGVGVKPNQYRIITSGNVSETSPVPEHIEKPDYDLAILNKLKRNKLIDIKSDEEIQRMRRAGSLAKHVLAVAKSAVKPGVTTDAVDKLIHREIISLGAYPSPLHYKGFPKSCCTSVNNVVCHGVPDDLQLVSGDIINIDVTVFFDGCHGDTSDTYAVGEVDVDAEKLIATTRECLRLGVDVCRPGAQFRSIAEVIERRASQEGFSVCRHFVGHGIGSYFHGPPNIFHFVSNRCDERSMEPGMVFTIEPILMEGQPDVGLLRDGWTVVSKDNARSAQAEHTVLITNQGSAILTL